MSKKPTLKSKWAHVSEYASLSTDGKISISGIFEELKAPHVPAASPQFFISGVFTDDPKSTHLLSLKIVSPDGKETLNVGAPQEIILGDNGKLNLVLGIGGFVFKEFGTYKVEIVEDDTTIASVEVAVKKVGIESNLNGKN